MIRLANINDIYAITNIYNQAIPLMATADTIPVTEDSRIKWFNEHSTDKYPIFVYEIDKSVVGWISLSAYRPGRKALRYTSEVSYYVDNNFKRKGLGYELMNYIINNCTKYQIKTVFAIVLEHNIPSINLLKKFNFEMWGKLPNVADFDGKECSHLYYGLRVTN